MAEPLLFEAGVIFAILAVGGAVASRVGQSVIPAYIVAGVLLGPNAPTIAGVSLAIVETRPFVTLLAEFGIVFLLFFIGLEFNFDRLLASRGQILRAGGIDLALNGAVGVVLALALGFTSLEALFIAGIVTISSSAVITKSLIELGWIADPETETILGLLVAEDIAVAVYLAVLAALVGTDSTGLPADLADAAGIGVPLARLALSVGVIVALVLLAFYGTPLLERLLAVDSPEQFLLRVVAAAVAVGGTALAAGVSEAVAAFFLGAAFGATSHVSRIESVISSERDIYAAVFFLAIGLQTNPGLLPDVAVPVAALVVVTTASKLASGYLGGQVYGLGRRRSIRVALAMVARGEFSLVIAALAAGAAATTPAIGTQIQPLAVGYVLVMSVLGTVLMGASGRIESLVGAT